MISDSITAQVCGAPTEAVETAAPWERWKTQKTGFPPFPPRLENSPQKTRSEFSTVPTASAANIFYLKRELVSSRRTSCSRTWFAIAILRCNRKQAGSQQFQLARRSRESFCLTSPFIERGQGDLQLRQLSTGHRYAVTIWEIPKDSIAATRVLEHYETLGNLNRGNPRFRTLRNTRESSS